MPFFLPPIQVKFTGYKDRPVEERKRKFIEDLRDGHSVIVRDSYARFKKGLNQLINNNYCSKLIILMDEWW